jgi:hypothetical protein
MFYIKSNKIVIDIKYINVMLIQSEKLNELCEPFFFFFS